MCTMTTQPNRSEVGKGQKKVIFSLFVYLLYYHYYYNYE